MAINFNELPDSKPSSTIPKGRYKVKVVKAEMKQGKDLSKPQYLNLTLQAYDSAGAEIAKIYDIITEPSTEVTRFKVKRFVQALKVPLESFELRDLTKISEGKEFYADIIIQEGTNGYADKNAVDVFGGDIYYTEEDIRALDDYMPDPSNDIDPPFNAPDAADADEDNQGGPEY